MDKKEAYKEKVNAEIIEHSTKISALKAKLKSEAVDAKVASMEKIDELEKKLAHIKDKLSDAGDAAEGSWEAIKDRLEATRKEISISVKKLFADQDISDDLKDD